MLKIAKTLTISRLKKIKSISGPEILIFDENGIFLT
jgi:hypothetical protein